MADVNEEVYAQIQVNQANITNIQESIREVKDELKRLDDKIEAERRHRETIRLTAQQILLYFIFSLITVLLTLLGLIITGRI